ncbi:MAG TPA: hypothetical protein VGO65_07650 [Pseudolysinimonas sp.]|nr:hypothetical protein [Pseudolysinimonas sp.]
MPSDSELRHRFHEGIQPQGEIDVDAVLRRVRARRRPRIVLAAAGSVLAIAAIAVPAAVSSYIPSQSTALSAGDEGAAPEFATGGAGDSSAQLDRAPAEKLNLCTAPVAEIAPAENGLVITLQPVTAAATERSIPVTVTLTNGGTDQIFGTTGSRPALTLSSDGITIWHTNGPQDLMARIVDLGPGESMTYQTTFEPLVCGVEDDTAEAFAPDLPAAGPGTYLLTAAIDVMHDDGATIDLVTGPAVAVTLT